MSAATTSASPVCLPPQSSDLTPGLWMVFTRQDRRTPNALCDGTCLQDLELRRQDEVYLDALGARRIPDPTTAGDFCRRFKEPHIQTLIDIINDVRRNVWARQSPAFFERACIDLDGTMVGTTGECKGGMDISYNGIWGYHPLVVSLANTGEILSVINRPGNRPSHEGAAAEVDRAVRVGRDVPDGYLPGHFGIEWVVPFSS